MDSIAESIETDEDAAELQTSLEEDFAHDPELRAYYLEMFFGIQPENGNRLEELISEEEPIPSVNESPSASVEIKPAGGIGEAASVAKQAHKKNAEAAAPALANTGFDGFTDVIAGLLVALAGVVLVALGRRKSTKH